MLQMHGRKCDRWICRANSVQQLPIRQNHAMPFPTSLQLAVELLKSIHCRVKSPSSQAHHFLPIHTDTPENHCISFVQKIDLQNALWSSFHYLEIGNVSKCRRTIA
eukprot:Skav227684  [mRNA]  locus=scaffold2108:133258:133575:+ [translate_table: standard]